MVRLLMVVSVGFLLSGCIDPEPHVLVCDGEIIDRDINFGYSVRDGAYYLSDNSRYFPRDGARCFSKKEK